MKFVLYDRWCLSKVLTVLLRREIAKDCIYFGVMNAAINITRSVLTCNNRRQIQLGKWSHIPRRVLRLLGKRKISRNRGYF